MRWRGRKGSANVEDRRGAPMRRGGAIRRGTPVGLGGLVLVLLISWIFGANPIEILSLLGGGSGGGTRTTQGPQATTAPTGPPTDELGAFASVVLGDTEATWNRIFAESGQRYVEPTLVLFTGGVRSACGTNSSAVGPFYCPADRKLYLDLSFFDELARRHDAPGDFAAAYVIAHEVGHHVQNLLGVSDSVRERQQRLRRGEANALSVQLELQADCLAGVWGHYAQRESGMIEPGDFEEGLRAAAAIGDDRLQRLGQGRIQPESWTHGSSEQRVEWLRRGLGAGDPSACDTFGG